MATLRQTSSTELAASFVWGNDLSRSEQGAGGVGGLLFARFYPAINYNYTPPTVVYYGYDGNGNVTTLYNPASQSVAAVYEYDAFGQILRQTGPTAATNPFRFSTKFTDDESGLNYYGFRYYSPWMGRWISRDPIGEEDAENLYAFVGGDAVNELDIDGLEASGANVGRSFLKGLKKVVTGVRRAGGAITSIASGDAFADDKEPIIDKACNVVISVNGVFTNRDDAKAMRDDLRDNSPRYQGADQYIAAGNRTTWAGDIVQIIADELGLIQTASSDLADQINAAYDAFRRNGCCCAKIQVFAHSQGTKVFQRSLPMVRDEAKKMLCFTGFGGETKIDKKNEGLEDAENYANSRDPIPTLQYANPANWPSQSRIPLMKRNAGGHGYLGHYTDLAKTLKKNCPCTPISKR